MDQIVLDEENRVRIRALFQHIMMKNRECHVASVKLNLIESLNL